MLALSIEIPNKGDYKSMEVVGIPVLITRDKDLKFMLLEMFVHIVVLL